jgi:hypothetical protein
MVAFVISGVESSGSAIGSAPQKLNSSVERMSP